MKNITFIFIGAPKNKNYAALEKIYLERITHYAQSDCMYVKDARDGDVAQRQKTETELILKKITAADCVIVCDEKGKSLDSLTLSKKISDWQVQYQRVVFIIGGAYGFAREVNQGEKKDPDIFARAQLVLKLSDFTLPHELARVVLVEQIYRALTILKGEKYHH